MSMLRGIDRAHDIDLGPSGYAPPGHHFGSLWGTEMPAKAARPLTPRCGFLIRGEDPCMRPIHETGKHQAQKP